jgi:hypothetical protein
MALRKPEPDEGRRAHGENGDSNCFEIPKSSVCSHSRCERSRTSCSLIQIKCRLDN